MKTTNTEKDAEIDVEIQLGSADHRSRNPAILYSREFVMGEDGKQAEKDYDPQIFQFFSTVIPSGEETTLAELGVSAGPDGEKSDPTFQDRIEFTVDFANNLGNHTFVFTRPAMVELFTQLAGVLFRGSVDAAEGAMKEEAKVE